MTYEITLPCADGTDPECEEELSFVLPYIGLTGEQIQEIRDGEGYTNIGLTPDQVEENELNLSDIEKEKLLNEGLLKVMIDLETTCGACGSDQ